MVFPAEEIQGVLKRIEKLEQITVARGATIAEEQNAQSKIKDIKKKYQLDKIYEQKTQEEVFNQIQEVLRREEQNYDSSEFASFDDGNIVIVPVYNKETDDTTYWVNGHEFFTMHTAKQYAQRRAQKFYK